MRLSDQGYADILGEESLQQQPYPDQAGNWTVGVGRLMVLGEAMPGVRWTGPMDQAAWDALLPSLSYLTRARIKQFKPQLREAFLARCLAKGVPVGAITRELALAMFRQRLARDEAAVNACVRVPLAQAEFDVLVSLSFNAGAHFLPGSTLLAELNRGLYTRVPRRLREVIRSGGVVLPVLVARREREAQRWEAVATPDAPSEEPSV